MIFKSYIQILKTDQKVFWAISAESFHRRSLLHYQIYIYKKKDVMQRCSLSSAQAAALHDFPALNMQVQHTENILPKTAASTCSQHSSTSISLHPPATPRKSKQERNQCYSSMFLWATTPNGP